MNEPQAHHREVAWRGVDDASRLDIVSVEFGGAGGLVATGTQSTDTYRARWDLIVDSSWQTRLLTVDVEGVAKEGNAGTVPLWQRHLNLWRRDGGAGTSQWRSEGGESGTAPRHFSDIGIVGGQETLFAEAVDVDLAGCPLTNVMPIRRFGFDQPANSTDSRDRPIVTAWVSLPDLAVVPAAQTYSLAPDGSSEIANALRADVAGVVHYRSATRGVSVDLSFDSDGIVVDYPALAKRIELS